ASGRLRPRPGAAPHNGGRNDPACHCFCATVSRHSRLFYRRREVEITFVVESRKGAVACRTGGAERERRLSRALSPNGPSLRFLSPLIEPDVTISVIRLSDGFHEEACAEPRRGVGWSGTTPSSPNTRSSGNCQKPDPATLCRRRRKRRTVWYRCKCTARRAFATEP